MKEWNEWKSYAKDRRTCVDKSHNVRSNKKSGSKPMARTEVFRRQKENRTLIEALANLESCLICCPFFPMIAPTACAGMKTCTVSCSGGCREKMFVAVDQLSVQTAQHNKLKKMATCHPTPPTSQVALMSLDIYAHSASCEESRAARPGFTTKFLAIPRATM